MHLNSVGFDVQEVLLAKSPRLESVVLAHPPIGTLFYIIPSLLSFFQYFPLVGYVRWAPLTTLMVTK